MKLSNSLKYPMLIALTGLMVLFLVIYVEQKTISVLLVIVVFTVFSFLLHKIIKNENLAKNALMFSEKRFRAIFEEAPLGIAIIDPLTGKISDINPKYLEIIGYSKENVNNIDLKSITHPDDLQVCLDNMALVNANKIKGFKMPKRCIRSDGSVVWGDLSVATIETENKEQSLSICMLEDITARKNTETLLKDAEQNALLIRYAVHVPGALYQFQFSTDGTFLVRFVSKGIWDIYEVTPEEAVLDVSFVFGRVHPDDLEFFVSSIYESLNTMENWKHEYRVCLPTKGTKWLRGDSKPEKQADGSVVWHGYLADITERKNAEETLQISKDKLEAIFNGSNDAIMLLTRKGFFDCNPMTLEMFGMSERKEFIESHPSDISPALQPDGQESLIKANAMIEIAFEKGLNRFEWMHQRKSGETFLAEVSLSAFNYGDERVLQAMVNDITERKLAEKKIQRSLEEKEVLLKEVHHRVKNNLQIILSILNLQYANITDKKTLSLIRDIRNRIKAMSFIHELLYQTDDFSSINFSEYISQITNNLIYSYDQNHTVDLRLDVGTVFLDLDSAIPCGLIINEIITNALKYAFTNQKEGEISISLTQKDKLIELIIADNGKGFPDNIDYRNTESLGMQLVVTLVKQLGGDMALDNSNGAKYTIIFKTLKRAELNH